MDIGPFDYYDSDKFPYTLRTFKMLRALNLINLTNTSRQEIREAIYEATGGNKTLGDFFMISL
jgi:hypothetical protein